MSRWLSDRWHYGDAYERPSGGEVADAGTYEPVQCTAFSLATLPSAGGVALQGPSLAVGAAGTVIVRGQIDSIDTTGVIAECLDASYGWRISIEGASDDDVATDLRDGGGTISQADYTVNAASLLGAPHDLVKRWTALGHTARLDRAGSAATGDSAGTGTPGNPCYLLTGNAGGTVGCTATGLQLAVFSAAIDVPRTEPLSLWHQYRDHPDLQALPIPEPNVLPGTRLGEAYMRDIDGLGVRGGVGTDHALPTDLACAGCPATSRLSGLTGFDANNYVQDRPFDGSGGELTFILRYTNGSSPSATEGFLLRDAVADNLGLGLYRQGGTNMRAVVYDVGSGFLGAICSVGQGLTGSTMYYVAASYSISNTRLRIRVYSSAGSLLASDEQVDAAYAGATLSRDVYVGRTAGGGYMSGTIHEIVVHEAELTTAQMDASVAAHVAGSGYSTTSRSRLYPGVSTGICDAADATALWKRTQAGTTLLAARATVLT